MAEINPLLPNERNRKRNSTAAIHDSLSSTSVSAVTSEIHPYTTNDRDRDPPAEITHYQSYNHSVNHYPHQRPNFDITTNKNYKQNRSPNSSRSKTDKIGSYNLDNYTDKIPSASSAIFVFLLFGILFALLAIAVSCYLVLITEGEKIESTNHSDLSNIVLPLIMYIMNAVECSLFYLEARMFQLKGYTQLFQEASHLSKINFRFVSMYFVLTYAIYAFLFHHLDYFPDNHDLDIIFLGIWSFGYVFIIVCLCKFGQKFYAHNRDKPRPDLFFPHDNNPNYIKNSPLTQNRNLNILEEEQTDVIQKLYKDKSTLIRQLNTWKLKYEHVQSELEQLQNDNASLLNAGALSGGISSNDVIDLKNQIKKLRTKLRFDREQTKTLNTQIETKKTMLEAQIAETQQLRNVLQTKDERIAQLIDEKESLERETHACNDQKDDLSLLYQVKEQEVEIAKEENDRLRKKLQLHMQNMNMQPIYS